MYNASILHFMHVVGCYYCLQEMNNAGINSCIKYDFESADLVLAHMLS